MNQQSQMGNQSSNPQQQQQQYAGQPHMQQQQPQGGRMGNIPMLTPQLLQSLTPQQLQAMKNHPQFQEMMRNYMQRQQLLQQQQQQQKNNIPPNNIPQQNAQLQMTREQLMKQQMLLNQQRMAQGLANPDFQQQQQQQIPINQMSPQTNPQMQSMPHQVPPPQQMPNFKGPGSRVSSIGAASSGINASPQIIPPTSSSASASATTSVGVLPNGAPISNIPGVSPLVPGQSPPNPPNSSSSDNNALSQEFLSKIPMNQLTSYHDWSDELKREGKEVPLDTKIYESIIYKDGMFPEKLSKQMFKNKSTMEQLNKDLLAYNQIKQLRMNSITLSQKNQLNNSIWGEGYQGYGNGITNSSTKLLLPERDYTDRMINETVARNDLKEKQLVPIRLEFDQERDQFKLRDTFLWDLNERIINIEEFTRQLMDDYKFIPRIHFETILTSIKEQIAEYQQKPYKTLGELRIPIKIDVTINNSQLTDQFEWDILNSEENDPEEFARSMCDELYLPGEFSTAIAHSIREQSQMYYKALNIVGYNFDGSPVQEDEIRNRLLPSLRLVSKDYQVVDDFFSILRNPSSVPEYSPQLIKLTQLEVERLDKEMERESRRKRRHNYNEDQQTVSNGISSNPTSGSSGRSFTSRRIAAHVGRGNTIPDLSDIPKTFRTPAPSSILPGGVDLGVPEIYEYNEVFINRTQIRNPDYRPPTPEPINNNRVFYDHDVLEGTFKVSIKLPV